MRLIIAGCRDAILKDVDVDVALKRSGFSPKTVLSGGASGADKAGEAWAAKNGVAVEHHPADWDKHGRAAGPIRNSEMARMGDGLLLFWDGVSRGSRDMLSKMLAANKPVWIVMVYSPAVTERSYAADRPRTRIHVKDPSPA